MNALDDDDGVVDHYGNGEHHGAKGQQVDTESDDIKYEECTNQGYRDGNGRNQCRAQVLQEDVYHDEHQNKGFNQRFDYFMNGSE